LVGTSDDFHAVALTLTLLYVVNLLFGDAVDAIEDLLIYSTKPPFKRRNESLRAGEINNSKMLLMKQFGFRRMPTHQKVKRISPIRCASKCLLVGNSFA
jgi:hypothetical protein